MSKVAHREATYEDLLQVADNLVAEIVGGELHTSPRPAPRHGRAELRLSSLLLRAFDDGDGGPGGWWIMAEPELHLGRDVLVPDVGGWRRERVPEFPETPAWTIAPDWVCEVTSPRTRGFDRVKKLPTYARHQVAYAWIVDPIEQSLEVFRLGGGIFGLIATHSGDELVRAEPFESVELPLASLWLPRSNQTE